MNGVGSGMMLQDNIKSLEEVLVKNFRTVSSSDAEQTWTRDTFGEAARDCLSNRLGHSLIGNRDRNHRPRCCKDNIVTSMYLGSACHGKAVAMVVAVVIMTTSFRSLLPGHGCA